MIVFIANFGQENYLWEKCLDRNTIATIDNEKVHPFWVARDRKGFIDFAMRHLKTARKERPIKPVASRWYTRAAAALAADLPRPATRAICARVPTNPTSNPGTAISTCRSTTTRHPEAHNKVTAPLQKNPSKWVLQFK